MKRLYRKKKKLDEMSGAGGGGTTTATFQPAVGPGGAPSKSGAFPGAAFYLRKRRKKKKLENAITRPFPTPIEEAISFDSRLKRTSLG